MVDQVIQNTFLETYRDDFTDSAGFQRILFNNGRAVQARELTQLQTIIQKEITRFGDNVFKEGAIVHSGGFSTSLQQFAKLNETTNGLPTNTSTVENTTFTGSTSGVEAIITYVENTEGGDPGTIYFIYTSSNGSNTEFQSGENISNGSVTLTIQSTNTTSNPAFGKGIFLTNNEGVYYVSGRFVFSPKQTVLVSKYVTNINDDFGFLVEESIVTSNDDVTLYDNSGSFPNTSSPGADRYKIGLALTLRSFVDSDQNFVYVGKIINGTLSDIKKPAQEENFNIIRDIMAVRTSEESGDYVVKPFILNFEDNTTDNSKLDITIQPGTAYVDGYRVATITPRTITVDKPRTTTTINNEVAAFTLGNYVLVNGVGTNTQGLPNINTFATVNLRSAVNHGGSTIGTARVRAVDEDNSGNYRLHLFEIAMNAGQNFRSVRSIGNSATDYMNTVLELGQTVLKEPKFNSLLFPLPNSRPENLTDISLATQRRFTASVTTGSASLTLSASGETFANTNDWIISVNDSDVYSSASITGAGTTSGAISGLGGGATNIEVLAYVNKANGSIRSKTLVEDQTDTINSGDWESDGNGTIYADLIEPDVYNFTSVTRDTVSGNSVRSRFILDNGQRDNHYGLGRLVLRPGQSIPNHPVVVKYDYFTHGVSGDFFAVNSYSGQVNYEDIPSYTLTDGTLVQLRDVLDFRPVVNSAGTFGSGSIINELPQPNDTIQADISYFNHSYNKLVADTNGNIRYIAGGAALDPKFPPTPTNALDLYRITLNPYTLDHTDLVAKQIEHKHYTMKDIGRIEKRLSALEEVTSLSLLELDTANFAILDSDGNNRTKSGFFVDNFSGHFFSDLNDADYKAAIDPSKKFMRPRAITQGINLMFDSDNPNNLAVVKRGDNIYLKFTHRTYINQNQASGTENVTPFWGLRFEGHIILSPSSDNWIDQTYIPDAVVTTTQLDTSGAYLYGDHEWNWGGTPLEDLQVGDTTNTITLSSTGGSSTSTNTNANAGGGSTTTTTQNNWTSTTTGVNTIAGETTITSVVGDRLLQIASIPFARSVKIYFHGRGFRPDTQVFPFFSGYPVSDWCRSETFVRSSNDPGTVGNVHANAVAHPEGSSDLITDANGTIQGSFFLPATDTLRFHSGTKVFELIDITTLDIDNATTFGKQIFTSAGVLQTRQRDVISTRILEINSNTDTTNSSSSTVINTVVTPPPPPPAPTVPPPDPPRPPVQPRQPVQESSCFVAGTRITMGNGSKKNIQDVQIGEKLLGQDGMINTVLEFDHPQLTGRDLIGINGNGKFMTPEHPVFTKNGWRSYSTSTFERQFPDMLFLNVKDLEIGDEILREDGSWLTVTSLEVFKGEPEQTVYNFILDGNHTYFADGLLVHNRGAGAPDPLAQSFLITETNGIFVTKVDLFFATKDPGSFPVWIQIRQMDNGYPAPEILPGSTVFKFPGEITTSSDASVATTFEFDEPVYLSPGKEYCVVALATVPTYNIYISKIGDFVLGTTDAKIVKQPFLGSLFKSQNNTTWTATQWEDMKIHIHAAKFEVNSGVAVLTNTPVPQKLLTVDPLSVDSADATITVHQPNHGFTVGDTVNISGADEFAGISAASINGERTITVVDATGYQFEADSASTSAEIGGGTEILSDQNILMDIANINLATLIPTDTAIQTSLKTTTAQSIAGIETAYQLQSSYRSVEFGTDIVFDAPQMIANADNETTYLSGEKSFRLGIAMSTIDENVSPVIDLQRATVLAISNIIDKPAAAAAAGFNVPINFVAETNPKGGSAVAKHISKVITLAQDAVGVKIFISANKPSAATFEVFFRVASGDNNISDIAWTLVAPETALISDNNLSVFREYNYLVGGTTGTLDAFNRMQIKIVMLSENNSKVPVFKDIRAIALSV